MITEVTANVSSISDMVANDAFGGEEIVLLDKDNPKITDTLATKG